MEYKKLSGLTPDGQIYFNDNMNIIEAMLPTGGFQTAHAPTMLELENGDILLAWFAGSFEGDADINIICSRLSKKSNKWEEPIVISNDPKRSDQNPSLFMNSNGEIWVMYTSQLGRQPGINNMQYTSQIRKQVSNNFGKTWSNYETIFPESGTFARQPIQILSNGRWIYGNWICSDSNTLAGDISAFKISDDNGKSWKHVEVPNSFGRVHPTVVEFENGHLKAFMRSRLADYIYFTESFDYGDSWSEPLPTILPNNNSGISAIKLDSGRLAIAYNPTSAFNMKNNANWPGLRCPVAIALSEDEGKTFPLIRNFEMGQGYIGDENKINNLQYEYPFIMQSKDGYIHLSYAYKSRIGIKWSKFKEEDIIGEKRGEGLYNPTSGEIK